MIIQQLKNSGKLIKQGVYYYVEVDKKTITNKYTKIERALDEYKEYFEAREEKREQKRSKKSRKSKE